MIDTEFLQKVEVFLVEASMPASTFGKRAVRDPRFVADLRNGRHVRPALQNRVLEFIRANSQSDEAAA